MEDLFARYQSTLVGDKDYKISNIAGQCWETHMDYFAKAQNLDHIFK